MFTGNQLNDNMHRQSSRTPYNADTIECIVNTSDLAFEGDRDSLEPDRKRAPSDARRNSTSKRPNGTSTDRSSRHSPSTVTHKRSSSPSSTSLLSSRSQHHYSVSQRSQRVSGSPSPPPPPTSSSSSSRYSRSSRPAIPGKRPRSHSRSPPDRRPSSAHRSYPTSSKKRPVDNEEFTSTPSVRKQATSTKTSRKQDTTDLSIISEDELVKPQEHQVHSSTADESSSASKLHSTPSVPILRPTSNKSLLDMSDIPQDAELSLFAKSSLSMPNMSSVTPTPAAPVYDIMQTIDLMSKYKAMLSTPSHSPEVERCSKEIFALIQQQIELHKQELGYRKREMELRARELSERERQFEDESARRSAAVNNKPEIMPRSTSVEEKPRQQPETTPEQETKTVIPSEPEKQSVPATIEPSKVNFIRTESSEKPSSSRAATHRSRFSALVVDPSMFSSQNKPTLDLYAGVDDDHQSPSSVNSNNPLKKAVLSPILAPGESAKPIMDHDLKVTSSNSCRKVEIQSDTTHQTVTSKEPPQDLRLTLRNNRNKQHSSDDNKTSTDQPSNSDEETVAMTKPTLTKTISNDVDDDKQQSHDYQQQRSISSTSIDATIDDIIDKRPHRHQEPQHRTSSSRQQPYPRDNASSSAMNSNERSYSQRSTSHQSSRSGSSQRRHEPDELRPRYVEQKYPRSTRPPHRGYH